MHRGSSIGTGSGPWPSQGVEDPLYEQDEEGVDEEEHRERLQDASSTDKPTRPAGPQPLTGRRKTLGNEGTNDAEPLSNSNGFDNHEAGGASGSSSSSKVPAAGAGTRVGPRPVPKSSSSLRHISSNTRNVSFGVPAVHDTPYAGGEGSAVQRQLNADKRRLNKEEHDIGPDAEDDSEGSQSSGGSYEADLYGSIRKRKEGSPSLSANLELIGSDDDEDYGFDDAGRNFWQSKPSIDVQGREANLNDSLLGFPYDSETRGLADVDAGEGNNAFGMDLGPRRSEARRRFSDSSSSFAIPGDVDASAEADARKRDRYLAAEPGGPSLSGPKRAPWHPKGPAGDGSRVSPPLLGPTSGLMTPGPQFPQTLHTPVGTPPEHTPIVEPRQRLEWYTMLESVLASEVLRSETKRINSADAPSLTKEKLMYHRWLDIRASLRGRGHLAGAVETEEKRLASGWPIMVREVIGAINECRGVAEKRGLEVQQAHDDAEAAATTAAAGLIGRDQVVHEASRAVDDSSGIKEKILDEVGQLLARVDSAEEQFPSMKKIVEVVPEWGSKALQDKLEALYSWYNVTNSLRLQIGVLQKWTGSDTLEIAGHQAPNRQDPERSHMESGRPHQGVGGPPGAGALAGKEMEESTFLERILKEDSLQSTFEKRTLSTLNALILKAKASIIQHHNAFSRMALPSFEPELVQLINFPTRIMEGALKLRLDYAGKLRDPSVLIIDSLTDDLRAAIALACRIKIQYTSMMIPDPANGWELPPCIGIGYDDVLRQALRFFFKLLQFKLKGAVYFKETEVLEPEWRFLSTAVEVIDGGDVIVAKSVTRFVNQLFNRIVDYFRRELSAPTTTARSSRYGRNLADGPPRRFDAIRSQTKAAEMAPRGPSTAGDLTKGNVLVTLEEKIKWIHQVFDSVRIRSRKLLSLARDIRNRLENAAEYDLSSLRPSQGAPESDSNPDLSTTTATPSKQGNMDLTEFLQTLINAGYFLVMTGTFEAEGTYLIAEPSLQDKPELIQELFLKCMRRVKPADEDTALAAEANANALPGDEPARENLRDDQSEGEGAGGAGSTMGLEDEHPRYLLLLSPRDAFMWTGRIMSLKLLRRIPVELKDRRLRLVADGPKRRLQMCKEHLYTVFAAAARARELQGEGPPPPASTAKASKKQEEEDVANSFPLEVISEHMAHMSSVQSELRSINQGVYLLSDTLIRSAPTIRRKLRGRNGDAEQAARERSRSSSDGITSDDLLKESSKGGDCDELIQNCYSMASEQGFRALPFIESARLQGQMTLALARLAIDWVAFICDDCEPTDRKTFKWAVAALENAMHVTRADAILSLSEQDFTLMRSKVASCIVLLISHFDILGARSSVAKAKEEEERLEREKAERNKVPGAPGAKEPSEMREAAAKLVQGMGGVGAPPMLGRADSGMQATEERWVQKVMEWDAARQSIEAEQRLIGRVLDDTKFEDRGLQNLASSSSRIQIRWQQGRFIGGGTFGTVYLAVNLDSGGLMAVKEIRFQDISSTPGFFKQIKDEMSVMEMLSHPNIVEYYGIEVHRDKVYIFEEYCQGGSLAQLLEHGRIEDETVIQVYTLQMLDGLVYLHSKGVVHRDIKPDNILLDHLGVIKFVDFGAAKVLAKNQRTIQRTRKPGVVAPNAIMGPDGKPAPGGMGSLQGTPMYMAPEVIKPDPQGHGEFGAMDVWSLGCVVLEFATGRRPWSNLDNEWAIMFHIGMANQHPPLPEPGQLSELGIDFIRQCLTISPDQRPSAAKMREHPWIQNLIDVLNAANAEEEAAAAAANNSNSGSSSNLNVPGGDSDGSHLAHQHQHHHPIIQAGDNAAGVAAMAATPGTRSIHGFNFPRPSATASLRSSDLASASSHESSSVAWQSTSSRLAPPAPTTAATSLEAPAEEETKELGSLSTSAPADQGKPEVHGQAHPPKADPGHPHHEHPGYEAQVADMAYRGEDKQTDEILAPGPPDLGNKADEGEAGAPRGGE
ncbi:hypothetical protein FA10DRAFT_263580 [Acaromyces ingoldii]|uniref:Protein kinase domain-containing protein n=1 Tax=Acaromyces ingoldii TaxID=215250 RepID=A0A316YTT6_9BASI|nr:hypothetical protein FA10DRAFT_263580 [Acaromyces ingoldii]PWN92827.1 hypothetical protein FA10DRAFT_263580 [Acaromyces ingoldii]